MLQSQYIQRFVSIYLWYILFLMQVLHIVPLHQLLHDLNGIFRRLTQADSEKAVHSRHVALTAHIVTICAAAVADLHLLTEDALHLLRRFQIDQLFLADQAFFVMLMTHRNLSFSFSAMFFSPV